MRSSSHRLFTPLLEWRTIKNRCWTQTCKFCLFVMKMRWKSLYMYTKVPRWYAILWNNIWLKKLVDYFGNFEAFSFMLLLLWDCVHQISHLDLGFISVLAGQWNTSENSLRFCNGPLTRNMDGTWVSLSICKARASFVLAEHHTWKNFRMFFGRCVYLTW